MIGRVAAAVAAAVGLALPGAASAQQSPSQESAVPIPPGQIEAAVGRIDGLAEDLLQRTGVPGLAVAVVHDDQVVYAKGFGVRKVGTDEPVDENTVFQLASVSKPLGATVIAGSVGRGKVSWEDPINEYLPHFALADPFTSRRVTIADLYAHRSGLPEHIGDLQEDMGYGQREILRRLRYVPLAPPLRSGYAYTNFGLTVGALAAARAERSSWQALSSRNLYAPLGMTATSSRLLITRALPGVHSGTSGSMTTGRRSLPATLMPRPRPAAQARASRISRSGCACNSQTACITASA